MATPGCPANADPTRGSPVRTATVSPGQPDSTSSSAKAGAVKGVFADGSITTGQPAAIADATLITTAFSGCLHDGMPATSPIGSGRLMARRRWPGIRTLSPRMRSASTAATRRLAAACSTSRRVARRQMPDSLVIRVANRSAPAWTAAAARPSMAARSAAGSHRDRLASSRTAASTCSAPSRATLPTTSPVHGSRTANWAPAGRTLPARNICPAGYSRSLATVVMRG
jgi:hypothetical protein